MVERGLAQWKRQKKALPTNQLKVTFIGESGVDTGALRKEFLTDMVVGIEQKLFEGDKTGKCPKYSMLDLDQANFRRAGEIWAASLAQGGPPPCCLKLWVYKYLCDGELQMQHIQKEDVCDVHYSWIISQVESATDDITDLTEEILNCGYHGPISVEKKQDIVRSVVLHAILRLLPFLSQLREGLKLYGLASLMSQYPKICQPLFVPGVEMKADADFVFAACHPEFSEKGSSEEQVEFSIMNHLQDFLQELETNEHTEVGNTSGSLSPSTFLQWLTGQGHVPLLPQEMANFKVFVYFSHTCHINYGVHTVCYPTVSACSNTIHLPVQHMQTFNAFKQVMTEAFFQGQGFHLI
ncbi:uncharacterized protein LOC141789325 [Halichoeres trimaculatus]|uniref:uncharacterized protein LOC141789325 n=1 Tax=Halichoeres trimaculatus TaxID=147232 RepID=UPI003D9DE92E